MLLTPVTYYDVTVFSGDANAADASYKNLIWENLPAPEILFHVGTPAIVSLGLHGGGGGWWLTFCITHL